MVFSPSGELLGTYVKEHLVRGFETPRLAPGQDLLLVDAQARAGVEICKDMDFPALTRRYADAGAAVLLVPAWDFGDDGWMHARMAVLRGVEQGLPVARSAQSGLLTASDAFGRVQDEARTGDDAVSQVVVLRAGRIPTLYGRWGDWFAYASAGLLLLVLLRLVWLVVRGRHFTSRAAALRTIRAASS